MRFDKVIWDTSSSFYDHVNDRKTIDVRHFNESTKAWVSIWLDLVSNDRTVPTKRADVDNLPNLITEFLDRMGDIQDGFDGEGHRIESCLRELIRNLSVDPVVTAKRYPASVMLKTHGTNLLTFLEAARQPQNGVVTKAANAATSAYGVKEMTVARKLALRETGVAASRLKRSLDYGDRYLEDCVNALRALLERAPLSWEEKSKVYYLSATVASQFLLRQHSARSLSELHLIALRGDNAFLSGRSLADRLRSLFSGTISPNSSYTVYFRVDPKVTADELLPPYVQIVERPDVEKLALDVTDQAFRHIFLREDECSYLRVKCEDISPGGSKLPDRFTAASMARSEVSKVLDVLFMVRPRTVQVEDWCLVLDETTKRVADVELFRERDYGQDEVRVRYLHEPQADLQRALHWYRKAMQSHSDESGLLEAWISVEYLAQGLKDSARNPEIAVIQRYFPHLLAMRAAVREMEYLFWCIRTYITNTGLRLPADYIPLSSTVDLDRISCLLRFVGLADTDPRRLQVYKVFENYPHIIWELQLAETRLKSGPSYKEYVEQLRQRYEAMFYRVYALRNEIVHNARVESQEIPLLRRVFGDALRELYQELLVVFRHQNQITVEQYFREVRQEYQQLLDELSNQVTPEVYLGTKFHFTANL